MKNKIIGWHFTRSNTLAYGDNRPIIKGEILSVEGPIVPCENGLHASVKALDALKYAPGNILWKVELSGEIVSHGEPEIDKYAASQRKVIGGGRDASKMLMKFARLCALDVIDLWEAPEVVKEYLRSGDEALREQTRAAAYDAANAAACAANATAAAYYAAAYYAADTVTYAAAVAANDAANAGGIKILKIQEERLEDMFNKFIKNGNR